MASIVKANSSLTNGGLAVLKRGFSTSDDGRMTYAADYCCLSSFAKKWTPYFKIKAQPPTPLPASVLELKLTKTPELSDLQTETMNGLTYFRATYSAGILTEVVITESSEQRSFSGSVTASVQTVGNLGSTQTVTGVIAVSFDYISTSVTAQSKNQELPAVKGSVGSAFNKQVGTINGIKPLLITGIRSNVVESTSTTKTGSGELTYSKTSTGIYEIGQSTEFSFTIIL